MFGTGLRTVRLGIKSLMLHRLRSFLTMLGLLFGVSSVISMLAVGEGASHEALEQIKALGPTNLMVRSQKPAETEETSSGSRWEVFSYGLKYTDAERIETLFPTAEHVVSVRETPKSLRNGPFWTSTIVVGTSPEYLEVMNLEVEEGRWLSAVDVRRSENFAVLGHSAAKSLFPTENPLGRSVQAGDTRFAVVGVLRQLGREASPGGMPLDDCVYVPISTSRARFGDVTRRVSTGNEERTRVELSEIKLALPTTDEVIPASLLLARLLELGARPIDDVKMIVPLELLRQQEATVTERTREIGIRRALGAKRAHIVQQFLVETAVLSGIGGALGVGLGMLIPQVITVISANLTIVQVHHVLLAFGISVGVGVAFGIYPAYRAANMDPVEALRHM